MLPCRALLLPYACLLLSAQQPAPTLTPVQAATVAAAPEPPQVRYTKQESMVPMRDGISLYTAIFLPKDTSHPHPILLNRTPYGCNPYGPDAFRHVVGPSPAFAKEDYIVVYQDVRGRNRSEGSFEDVRPVDVAKSAPDEVSDTTDTIDWLLKNLPRHNGRVGMWGISYPAHYAVQGLLSGHPALKAVSPQAPMMDVWEGDDSYHRGAFQLAANFGFFLFFHSQRTAPSSAMPTFTNSGSTDGYQWYLDAGPLNRISALVKQPAEPIWEAYLAHPTYDAYWQARNLRPHLKYIRPAVLTVGGWFDAEDLFGALACASTLTRQSPTTDSHLVMGPWTHGQWSGPDGSRIGNTEFGAKTAPWFQEQIELRFFNQYLKEAGDAKEAPLAKATVFETGRNQWRSFDAWPPRAAQPCTFYFEAQGGLGTTRPETTSGFDAYVSDPAKPVPYTQDISFGYSGSFMAEDQRFAARRPDVLLYQTPPLEADLTLAGPLRPVLQVSTSGTDADWIVKVIDVFPSDAPDPKDSPKGWHQAGGQMLVRGDVLRGKYRNSYTTPEPFTPGAPTEVAFTLPDVMHTFRKGHRLMVQIQSSWFPLVDRNPQIFCDIPKARPEDFQKAEQRVYHTKALPSRLEVLQLD